MDKLKNQINRLENRIDKNRQVLQEESQQLKQDFHSSGFLLISLIGGFAAGMFLGSSKGRAVVKDQIQKSPGLVNMALKNAHILIPLITSKFL